MFAGIAINTFTGKFHINLESLKFISALLTFKYPLTLSQKTNWISITNSNRLMTFYELINVYSNNYVKPINVYSGENTEFSFFPIVATPL